MTATHPVSLLRSNMLLLLAVAGCAPAAAIGGVPAGVQEGKEASAGPALTAQRNENGDWGLAVRGPGLVTVEQPRPLQIEIWDEERGIPRALNAGYVTLRTEVGGWIGRGAIAVSPALTLDFHDRWSLAGASLRLQREVRVKGNGRGGFLSLAALRLAAPHVWPEVEWFAPGMIYGNFDHLRDLSIGGRRYYQPGAFSVWVREDRMPAPVLGVRLPDGGTLAVLNPSPDGATTAAEGASFSHEPMVDARFHFGAVVAEERERTLALGYAFPGSEGELSYGRKTAQGPETEHRWRRRYHPFQDGFVQRYTVAFRFDQAASLYGLTVGTWRWAWKNLQPQVNPQDLSALRRHLVDVLRENTLEVEDRAGVQIVSTAIAGGKGRSDPKSIMGFIGYALGAAELMLVEARRDSTARGQELRRLAEKSIASFLRLPMNPPAGEGFHINTGAVAVSQGGALKPESEVYLRCFCDDMKSLLRAYEAEKLLGREHPEWLAWVRQFAEWLLTQEQPGGGFPRSWQPGTGALRSGSTTGTFNTVPLFVRLHRLTGQDRFLRAAERAADFGWRTGQSEGRFVGGTIDNPDVIDKEAATIAFEGFLDLYEATRDACWKERARASGDIAETWMYIWNVPMPADADDGRLHWKRGVPAAGLQLIATGHSLVDAYMAFDVGSYARLARLTGDAHYLEVARILLHNTKAMVALPGRPLGLRGPGWQQEHYCLTLPRGVGRHQEWLPWVAVSQLRGINDLIAVDPQLYAQIAGSAP